MFGLPGGAISPLNDALLDAPAIKVHFMRHEATAVFAACGYAMQAERVGVAFVTSGPGATNAMTAVASAHCDAVPIVVLVGEVPRGVQGKGALQDGSSHNLNIAGMFRPITKAVFEATDAHSLPHTVRRAFAVAMSGKRGPVVVTMPLDVQLAKTFVAQVTGRVSESHLLDDAVLDDVAARLLKAKRPVIFAGNGCRNRNGASALLRLAEHTGIPVITTPKGKGVFPEDHRLTLGVFGIGGHVSAQRYLEEGVDCVLALGTSFGDLATDGWSSAVYPSRTLIQVDIDGASFSKAYAADVAIIASVESLVDELLPRLPRSASSTVYGIERQVDVARSTGVDAAGRMFSSTAITHIQQQMPARTIFTVDSGEHTLFALHYLSISEPDGFMAMTGLGSMGSSIAIAIGAALAKPDRQLCVIIGDGGYAMVGMDLLDVERMGVNVKVFVMDDGRMTMCELGHQNVYGRSPSFELQVGLPVFCRCEAVPVTSSAFPKTVDRIEALSSYHKTN